MPTLQFKGKNIIWNHHLAVPFHTLDEIPDLHYNPEKANGNMIIEGDNLVALKALLPQFSGKVKCIYIDPPYNTGNEGWVYNDKVNSPLLKDWIGKEVAKDDLTRHDKWLCMMVPRLKLLFQLMNENGVIFISIDDNELSNLISSCNEIFGEENLISVLPRITKKAGKTSDNISKNSDYIVVYKRVGNLEFEKIEIDDEGYKHSDEYEEERGKYKLSQTLEFIENQFSNDNSRKEIEKLFGYKAFDYSKPSILIKKILELASDKDSIVLDSYAGSGSTMHAVLELNKEDGGNRKCIMVQMTEATEAEPEKNICKDITRERVKRAIDKFGYESGFKYYRVGIPLDAETMLAGQLPTYSQFAKYVYYLCSGENLENEDGINEETYFVGEFGKQAIYLVYKQDYDTLTRLALNLSMAERIKKEQPGKRRIVYAPSCFLDEEYLAENQIDYVGIPYNLFQRTE
ncbi:MAG TPA: site-specific DNA-methyltransferase [Mariniphaga anaerophila]|uniref:site-specific DNA-methyltransferase (adenine-specific) n=1 Tax=Mariniphaga anaerophila TaxID=1484053 RepID=A0A831LXN3_9BACT|nr:site-specific DNA-methyltransferase [Mariniphaga anaerophila]